jgi:hypothetical protein
VWCQKVFESSQRAYSCSSTCRSRIKRAGWTGADLYLRRIEDTDKVLRAEEIASIPLLGTIITWLMMARAEGKKAA